MLVYKGYTLSCKMVIRPIKKNKCVSGNGSEILDREGRHIFKKNHFLFLKKNVILCILKGILPFKMHQVIYIFLKKI